MKTVKAVNSVLNKCIETCHLQNKDKQQKKDLLSLADMSRFSVDGPTTSCSVLLADLCSVTSSSKSCLPDLWVALTQDLRQQLRGLLEAATQFIQLLLHGEDTLL